MSHQNDQTNWKYHLLLQDLCKRKLISYAELRRLFKKHHTANELSAAMIQIGYISKVSRGKYVVMLSNPQPQHGKELAEIAYTIRHKTPSNTIESRLTSDDVETIAQELIINYPFSEPKELAERLQRKIPGYYKNDISALLKIQRARKKMLKLETKTLSESPIPDVRFDTPGQEFNGYGEFQKISAEVMVRALREMGYEVTCKKTVEL